ncbi:MAG: PEP-CTERM sorting domain-containing protein [Chthoniobacterales bacterium]
MESPITNFSGSTAGFNSTSFSQRGINSYFQFGTGFVDYCLSNRNSTFTVISAIPEPSTYVAAIGLLALMLWLLRRRRLRGEDFLT